MIYAERPGSNLVSSAEVTDPWAKDYSCPDCMHETHFVKAHLRDVGSTQVYVMAHFRHNPSSEAVGSADDTTECSVGEHSEHERMRIIAFEMLKSRCANGSAKVPPDFPAHTSADMDTGPQGGSKTKRIGGRHPDAYIEFDESDDQYGHGIVLEVQYRHTDKPIKQVTHDYLNSEYSVLWTRPKNYTDTGHGVELGNIIPPSVDYPFIDEYRSERWTDLFPVDTATELSSSNPPTEAIQPLLTDTFANQVTFREQWIPSHNPVAENNEPTLDSTTDKIGSIELDGDVPSPFEVRPLPDGHEKSCCSCGRFPSSVIIPRADRAGISHHLPLCDDCATSVARALLRMHRCGELQPEDFLDIADRAGKPLYPVVKLTVTDHSAKKRHHLEASRLDDPVERLRVEFHSDHEGATVHHPSRFFSNLRPDSCMMTIRRQSSRSGRVNTSTFEIVDVENGCLNGLNSNGIVGRLESVESL